MPASQLRNGRLNGYQIGNYPKPAPGYIPPRGFIEVTEANAYTPLTPHFRLKQFLCKQAGGYPKYVALSPRLLTQLEVLLEEVNHHGIAATAPTCSGASANTTARQRTARSCMSTLAVRWRAGAISVAETVAQKSRDDFRNDFLR